MIPGEIGGVRISGAPITKPVPDEPVNPAPLCQVAFSVTDLDRTHLWYQNTLGFLPSGGTWLFRGFIASTIQGIPDVVSNTKWLVDQQNFRLQMGDHGKTKSGKHTSRKSSNGLIDVLSELRKIYYLINLSGNLSPGQAHQDAVEHYVFSAGKLRTKTSSQLQQGRNAAFDGYAAFGGFEYASDQS